MPGPAGIPALASKVLGPLAVEVLWEALDVLSGRSGVEILRAAYDGTSPEQCHHARCEATQHPICFICPQHHMRLLWNYIYKYKQISKQIYIYIYIYIYMHISA